MSGAQPAAAAQDVIEAEEVLKAIAPALPDEPSPEWPAPFGYFDQPATMGASGCEADHAQNLDLLFFLGQQHVLIEKTQLKDGRGLNNSIPEEAIEWPGKPGQDATEDKHSHC